MNSKSVSAIGVGWVILGYFAVLWFCFFAWMPPQPGGPDVFVFRDAGCNWAEGRGLVAASVPHANTVRPMLFASYTPGALLLFGVAASPLRVDGSELALPCCSEQCSQQGWSRSTPIGRRCRLSASWSQFCS